MRKSIFTFAFLFAQLVLLAVPQPGIWRCGGFGTYSFLSSAYFSNSTLQLQSEKIYIQIYKGFAVVKSVLQIKNNGLDTIEVRCGFPYDSPFRPDYNYYLLSIHFERGYALKVAQNGIECPLILTEKEHDTRVSESMQWYQWTNTFPPGTLTEVDEYAIVQTANSEMTSDWSRSSNNVFSYVFETDFNGYASPRNCEVYIQLQDEISLDDISGIRPDSSYDYDSQKKVLFRKFVWRYGMNGQGNIILAYAQDTCDFISVCNNSSQYFAKADLFETVPVTPDEKQVHLGDPLDFGSLNDDPVLTFFVLFVLLVTGVIMVALYINKKTLPK